MKLAIFSFTERGDALAERLRAAFAEQGDDAVHVRGSSVREAVARMFRSYDALVFVGAAGIAVRMIAPFVEDKFRDPAVVSIDEYGRYEVPLLSGHVGGANALAARIAELTGGVPVISTASDLNGCFQVDLFAKRNGLVITDRELAKKVTAALLKGGTVTFMSDVPADVELPEGLVPRDGTSGYLILVSAAADVEEQVRSAAPGKELPCGKEHILTLVPRQYCLGIGCRKNADPASVRRQALAFLQSLNVRPEAVSVVASIDLKKHEPAVTGLAETLHARLCTFSAEVLNEVPGEFAESAFVKEKTGVANVCERAAMHVFPEWIAGKTRGEGVTFALSRQPVAVFFDEPEEETAAGKADCPCVPAPEGPGPCVVTGGAYQGKHAFAERLLKDGTVREIVDPDPARIAGAGTAGMPAAAEEEAERLLTLHPEAAFVLRETGCGVVPADPDARALREASGRLLTALSARVSRVYAVECGIARLLKG